uniref:NADH-quinone oxidoreductase subunit N n=1 Tax=Anaerolinea thermolimosa TaxID=229919 RepID=A0A7C4PFH5_9CHLR
MNILTYQPSMLLAILPECLLALLAVAILAADLAFPKDQRSAFGWLTACGFLLIALAAALFSRPGETPELIFGGMLRRDWASFTFRLIFLLGASVTALLASDEPTDRRLGEFYFLMVVATLGMSLMASSANLIMLFLAIETTSLPLYILAGFRILDQKSVEAGIKYMLYGAMTSAVMLYGFSLLWGFTGTANLYEIARQFQGMDQSTLLLGGAALLVLVGFGFKISAVPFHFWAPDVYEGAPTPVAGFLSTASKAAGFAVLVRVLLAVFPAATPFWAIVVGLLAAGSMLVGNILAMSQRNIKRLLAYSSIAQAGYILVGVASHSPLGMVGTVYYLASYLVTNLAAFGIVWLVGREVGSDDLDAYAGLGKRNPTVALAMLISLLSLGGIPPLSGFFGKLLVFGAAVQAGIQGESWLIALAFVGVLTSVVGLYYYLNVMKTLYRPGVDERSLQVSPAWRVALLVCVAGMIVLGTVFTPMFQLAVAATGGWF